MYFDVYVNGKRIGSFGHADVENLSVSVSSAKDGHYLFAGVVCREDGKQFHYSWPQFDCRRVMRFGLFRPTEVPCQNLNENMKWVEQSGRHGRRTCASSANATKHKWKG